MKKLSFVLSIIAMSFLLSHDIMAMEYSRTENVAFFTAFPNNTDPGKPPLGVVVVLEEFSAPSGSLLPVSRAIMGLEINCPEVKKFDDVAVFIPCASDVVDSPEFYIRAQDIKDFADHGVERLHIYLRTKEKILFASIGISRISLSPQAYAGSSQEAPNIHNSLEFSQLMFELNFTPSSDGLAKMVFEQILPDRQKEYKRRQSDINEVD